MSPFTPPLVGTFAKFPEVTRPNNIDTSPEELGDVPFTFLTAPLTSATGIELTVVIASVPFPFT